MEGGQTARRNVLILRAAHEENLQLREEVWVIKSDEGEGRFLTPDEGQQEERRRRPEEPVPPGPAHGVDPRRAHGHDGREGD